MESEVDSIAIKKVPKKNAVNQLTSDNDRNDISLIMMDDERDNNERTTLLHNNHHKGDHQDANDEVLLEFRHMTPKQKCRAIFTFQRLKIVLIICIFIAACYLFASKEETPYDEYHMIATSQTHFYEHHFKGSPAYVQFVVRLQKLDSNYPDPTQITITLGNETWVLEASKDLEVEAKRMIKNEQKAEYYTVTTNVDLPVALAVVPEELGSIVRVQVIIAAVILVGVYILIVFELVHRTIAAMFGSFVSLAFYSFIHHRPAFEEVLSYIDFDTCGLLFGMMLMVGIFASTGFFEFMAVKMYKASKGNLWYLVVLLCVFTAVVSAFLDNVTTILLLTPVTIRLASVLDIDPIRILIAEVIFSNIGGTATVIGDPPNIIIVNDRRIASSGQVNFLNFMVHMGPGVIVTIFVSFVFMRFVFRVKREPVQPLEKEINIWRKTLSKIKGDNDEELTVASKLQSFIEKLEQEKIEGPKEVKTEVDIGELERKYIIKDKMLFISCSIILTGVIVLFFLHSMVEIHLNLAWIAIIGSIVMMISSGVHDIEEVLEKVEWGTLMFFAALFILMEGLGELGLISFIGDITANLIEGVPAGNGRLAAAVVLILWVSGIVSAFIDNIPFTTAMIPIIYNLHTTLGLPLQPLVWSLAFGTCFGGNGTLIGASANVVCAGLSEQAGHPISFNTFFKMGFPVMLLSLVVATAYLLVFHVVIPWYIPFT
eukprot:TRINITY_DN2033_c0_g1_i1.p1 TRINITY_DN2033_c0_g1~~TRINITY_DN2033_c0_g1_i1.p1  ORF type:complete len:712 (-),score=185.68 TRINITY_DN2033_c0_g1_i1:82-2217(-)